MVWLFACLSVLFRIVVSVLIAFDGCFVCGCILFSLLGVNCVVVLLVFRQVCLLLLLYVVVFVSG